MAEIRHFINGNDFGEPRNWQDLEITIDWLNKKDSGAINVSELAFVDEANEYLQQRVLDGLNGGVGVFEGDEYKITLGDQTNPTFQFLGYLDFTDGMTTIGGEEIICSLKKKMGEDWLNDVADGFSFAYLHKKGVITNSDFVRVPYVINFIPDGMQLIVLSMSIYMMTKEIIENIEKLTETIADITNAVTPVIGVSVGLGAGVVTAWDLGDFIMVALKALARLAYIIAMTIAIINLINQLFAQILPTKRNHLGMTFRKMMERGCQHLGLTFYSDIDELNWVHIPRKSKKGGSSGETGFPTNSEPIYLFGDLIRTLKEMFNADFRIKDGVFYLQRRDNFQFPSSYELPSYFNDQERLLQKYKLNTNEIVSNYNIYWALDVQDQNTLENSNGRVFQAITSPVSVNNQDYVTIKNLTEISLPFSMGLEKKSLNDVEKLARVLGGIVDGLTGIFGSGTNFKSKIEQRVGSLLLSSHFLTAGKVVKMTGSKLANDQRSVLDAKKLWDKFHFINSFAEYQGEHNQFFRYEEQRVPMTIQEFSILLENNIATDVEGNEIKIEKVIYSPYKSTAVIDYRIKKKYTNNLKIELL
ncbi:hypothetical protein HWC99_gp51 [Flavobacterium phage vB_FspS_tant8-1]|uniref:Uncharacterized protein n=1 Tax=Flavobacterium phage vB_FspS_tant8-1 TaxID=2686278 RepID=A0A6B9LG80_9CAUD|nr:hypothetical protein HWC99_gp51 [Flavobacterium phage vB_FspS_tant8-1]QHB40982.1 hypothetical protein tant81_gp051 [Flavobacterium phage vB_FspS_tant8-1]